MNKSVILGELENYSKQNWYKKNFINLLYAMLLALVIIFICIISDKNFFFYDDFQNQIMPYWRDMGNSWLRGEIPFLTKTLIGQNNVLEVDRGVFLPQNILMSILTTKIHSLNLLAKINAFVNITLMAFFSQKLSEALSLNSVFKRIVAFLFCINPIFLYIYLPSWVTLASGQVWFVATFASILFLRNNFNIKYYIFYAISAVNVYLNSFPNYVIGYYVVAFLFLVELLVNKEYKKIIIFCIISFSIFLIGINIYSEFIISSNLLNRNSAFGNFANFSIPTLNHLIFSFNPVYFNFISWYGGYRLIYIAWGYTSIYLLLFICFNKSFTKLLKNRTYTLLFQLVLVFFILIQLPTNFFLLRASMRFLPLFSEILILLTVYGISVSKLTITKIREKVFYTIVILSSVLSFFALENNLEKMIIINIFYILFTVIYFYFILKNKKISLSYSLIYTSLIFILMIFSQKSVDGVLSNPHVQNKVNMDNNFSKKGYILSLTNGGGVPNKENIEDLHSAQFLLYNLKSINGYSPLGHKKLQKNLDISLAHGLFNQQNTVNNLSNKYDELCYFDLMNITSIAIWKEHLTQEMESKIKSCGYTPKNVANHGAMYFIKDKPILGNISYTSDGIQIHKIIAEKNNQEIYKISTGIKSGEIILSKPYYRGYIAKINGKKIGISDEIGLLKLDNIPSNIKNGTLEISYFPRSWRVTLWLGLMGLMGIILTLIYIKKHELIFSNKTNKKMEEK